jgi:DNA-binding response OmpR family regulator
LEFATNTLRHIDNGRVPDVVLLDLGLPRLAGCDLHRELQAHSETRGIPVVVVTGTDTGNLDHAAFACVLHKPVDVHDVIFAVENCLKKARRDRFAAVIASAECSATTTEPRSCGYAPSLSA